MMIKTILSVLALFVMLSCSTTVKKNTEQPNITLIPQHYYKIFFLST